MKQKQEVKQAAPRRVHTEKVPKVRGPRPPQPMLVIPRTDIQVSVKKYTRACRRYQAGYRGTMWSIPADIAIRFRKFGVGTPRTRAEYHQALETLAAREKAHAQGQMLVAACADQN